MGLKIKCESCGYELDSVTLNVLVTGDATYKLCPTCLIVLVTNKLSRENFFNLIKNGHSSKEFYLHDDFYDYED